MKKYLIIFIFLLISFFWGNKTISINISENYYLLNVNEVINLLLLLFVGVILLSNLIKRKAT